MAWSWRYEDSSGEPVRPATLPVPEGFASQADAETWLGEHWRDLLDGGVAQVTLSEGGRTVYGPMGLDEA